MPCGVFISYQPGDLAWANHVSDSLVHEGIACRLAPRDGTLEDTPGLRTPGGSLIMILSSNQSPLPRQLIRELEKVRRSGLELRALRADEVQTPAGLSEFLNDLKRAGNLEGEFSIPSQFLEAVPTRRLLTAGGLAPLGYLESPKPVSKARTPALAASLAGLLFIGVWALRASSANLTEYEKLYAARQAVDRLAEADHLQAQNALESAQQYSSQDRWQDADRALSKAIALDPGFAPAYFERGRARFWEHEYLAAIEDFNSVIRLDPNLASGATTLRILSEQAQAKRNSGNN